LPAVAHFLENEGLVGSPPNEALVAAYRQAGLDVDLFAPLRSRSTGPVEPGVHLLAAEYGWKPVARLAPSRRWFSYRLFSCTCEEPAALAGTLATQTGRPLVVLADEIKNGSYAGDRSARWKAFCRWGMRQAELTIVNDPSRVEIQRGYAGLRPSSPVLVYPGCFREPPPPADRQATRQQWGVGPDELVLSASGMLSIDQGMDWILEALDAHPWLFGSFQPVNLTALERILLARSRWGRRVYVEPSRLPWRRAWQLAAAADVGLAIYRQQAPQWQNMGIASNRLCMFLAMGVPVIATRQKSFEFLEEYGCGRLVDDATTFVEALAYVRARRDEMGAAALECTRRYIRPAERFDELKQALLPLLQG
jgi:glycosyltransferase involved in cell wall biosynthesis